MSRHIQWKIVIVVLIISLIQFPSSIISVPSLFGQPENISPTLEKGIGLYKHENFDEALDVLKKAREEDPNSTLAAYYLGLNYKQLQNYKTAIPNLRDAVTYNPKIKGALIELVDCLYNYNELEEAHKWIAEAEQEGIRPAQVAFLKGLVLVKEEKHDEAVASFEKAKTLDTSMEQASDYQIGIANLKSKDYSHAQKAFEEAVTLDPSSSLAKYADEYIEAIARQEAAFKPWRLDFRSAWEYDDNVVLKPDASPAAVNIADKADWRTVYTTNVEYNKRPSDRFGIKAQYLFYFAKQNDLGFYDTISNTLIVQPSLYYENSVLTFPATYSHTIVDDRSYLSTPSLSGIYNRVFGEKYMGQVYIKYDNKDFMWTPATADENRDANGVETGSGLYAFFAKRKGFVNLRYGFDREWTKGANWEYLGNRVNATVLIPYKDKLNWTLTGGAFFQDFVNTHTTFNVKRGDNVYSVATQLAYKFHKDCELQVQYTHVRVNSNIDIYEYTRNIYSTGVEVKF